MPGFKNQVLLILALLVLGDAFFIPDIYFGKGVPSFQITDFLLPIIAIFLLPKGKEIISDRWIQIVLIFSLYILIPIIINGRQTQISDYFEMYRFGKLAILFALFKYQDPKRLNGFIDYGFYALLIINLMHFYNVFDFNSILKTMYGNSVHLEFFGRNSLGLPAVKRMLGTMGNPNTNALLFLFFTCYYLPFHGDKKSMIHFFLAIEFLFLCQSRTSVLALIILILVIIIFAFSQIPKLLRWGLPIGIVVMYFIAWMLATSFFKYTSYSNSLLDGTAIYSGSLRSRWESWRLIGSMIQTKPWFGFAPYKSYFSLHHLYSENEYLLVWWRYGIFGLVLYFGIYFMAMLEILKNKIGPMQIKSIGFIGIMMCSALTNNPMHERSISVLFVVLLGAAFYNLNAKKDETAIDWK